MPSVTYNGQSFAIDGRRLWILGASIQYARVPPAFWRARISAARQAGFNTIETAALWSLHEPRKGRFVFDDQADIRKFIELCAAEGMKAVLRVGPFVGHDYDAGGIPGWLVDTPRPADAPGASTSATIALRENNEIFLEHVSRYFRKLLGEVSDLQATSTPGGSGPIILVQGEHAWACSNPAQVDKYLHEITRMIRESGVNVPVINANDLWQESPGTIDTWRGSEHLLYQLRQLRTVQPTAPRLVSEFAASRSEVWGGEAATGKPRKRDEPGIDHSSGAVLERVAEVLASGAQLIVSPFHGGTNFGFLGGYRPGDAASGGGFLATRSGGDAPLGEAGERTEKYAIIKRLVTFANHFSGVFSDLDPEYQPIALDPYEARDGDTGGAGGAGAASVVSLRGSQGRVVFVFGKPSDQPVTLVLDNGLRLPVTLGDQRVTWTALDADLQGAGRLDYCNICPWAVIDRSIVVFHGPAGAPVFLSIDNVPLEATVPADSAASKPLVLEHNNLTVVILNRRQIDATYYNGQSVYVGVAGLDVHGHVMPSHDGAAGKPWVISAGARIEPLTSIPEKSSSKSKTAASGTPTLSIGHWQAHPMTAYVNGTSPRFASLEGPATLSDCGAPTGYGWYRARFSASGKVLAMLPCAGDRVHVFLNGHAQRIVGIGPGGKHAPFEIKFDSGDKDSQMLVALADNLGRASSGNDLARRKGVFGHLYSVKAVRGKAKIGTAKPVNGFALRGFVEGRASDHLGDVNQAIWTFDHPRKSPIIIDIDRAWISGTFVLNDKPIAYFAGASGYGEDRILLEPDRTPALKRGKNVLRFAPDQIGADVETFADRTTLYEAVDNLTEKAEWGFAKWEAPAIASKSNAKADSAAKPARGQPCWWRASVEVDAATIASERALWLEVGSLSKGQAFINGHNLGRYFSATADGRETGPQTRLYVPTPWLKAAAGGGGAAAGAANDLLIFDEHGFEPHKVRLIAK